MLVASATATILVGQVSHCPNCDHSLSPLVENDPATLLLESQSRIAELETQLCLLNQKANQALTRCAQYEAEISSLRAKLIQPAPPPQPAPPHPASSSSTSTRGSASSAASLLRLSSLYPRSRQTSSNQNQQQEQDLRGALEREQRLRRAAENRLSATSREIEELSVALFEQANEMVGEERRLRATLERRIDELEKRDVDKRRRLGRLESAMRSIQRARALLQDSPASPASPPRSDHQDMT